ncbi:MAG TPA: class I SAM-dependent methyltransferase [Candidatus Saccharimonadales bacterium]|nr:class I SAM-dependent methyltransferase [Candidatus Saccharimonadales bacterium]
MSEAQNINNGLWLPPGVELSGSSPAELPSDIDLSDLPPDIDLTDLPLRDPDEIAKEQYGFASDSDEFEERFSTSAIYRRELYLKYSYPERNIFREAGQEIQGQSILEIGYGDGILIKNYVPQHPNARVVGVDRASNFQEELKEYFEQKKPGIDIELYKMDARQLEFPDESFDCVVSMFVLYHSDAMKILQEIKRVLKPGGRLIVGLRSPGNQQKLWDFAGDVTKELRQVSRERGAVEWYGRTIDYRTLLAPPSFYSNFSVEMGDRILPTMFAPVHSNLYLPHSSNYDPRRQFGELHIPYQLGEKGEDEGWGDYKRTLDSLRDSCESIVLIDDEPQRVRNVPQGGDWDAAVDKVVRPVYEAEVKRNGYFTEYVKQAYSVWQKVPDSYLTELPPAEFDI